MSDATDFDEAFDLLVLRVQPDVVPQLTATELEDILLKHKRGSTWAASTAYSVGDVILPTVRTGHRYRAIVGGTSGATEPYVGSNRWPTDEGATVEEGSSSPKLKWQEDGLEYANIYDVRAAAYECRDLKVQKASQFILAGNLHMQQVYQQCKAERDALAPVLIG